MFLRKIVLLAIVALPLAGCDSNKPETKASSYSSQSEILDRQEEEEELGTEYKEFPAESTTEVKEGKKVEEKVIQEDQQKEEAFEDSKDKSLKDSETIDNTSSEADDTIY